MAINIGIFVFCIPINHPFSPYKPSIAGAPQITMWKYECTNGKELPGVFIAQIIIHSITDWQIIKITPIPTPIVKARNSTLMASSQTFLPYACDVIPLVPIRRNPNIQYIILNIIEPMAIAPI